MQHFLHFEYIDAIDLIAILLDDYANGMSGHTNCLYQFTRMTSRQGFDSLARAPRHKTIILLLTRSQDTSNVQIMNKSIAHRIQNLLQHAAISGRTGSVCIGAVFLTMSLHTAVAESTKNQAVESGQEQITKAVYAFILLISLPSSMSICPLKL